MILDIVVRSILRSLLVILIVWYYTTLSFKAASLGSPQKTNRRARNGPTCLKDWAPCSSKKQSQKNVFRLYCCPEIFMWLEMIAFWNANIPRLGLSPGVSLPQELEERYIFTKSLQAYCNSLVLQLATQKNLWTKCFAKSTFLHMQGWLTLENSILLGHVCKSWKHMQAYQYISMQQKDSYKFMDVYDFQTFGLHEKKFFVVKANEIFSHGVIVEQYSIGNHNLANKKEERKWIFELKRPKTHLCSMSVVSVIRKEEEPFRRLILQCTWTNEFSYLDLPLLPIQPDQATEIRYTLHRFSGRARDRPRCWYDRESESDSDEEEKEPSTHNRSCERTLDIADRICQKINESCQDGRRRDIYVHTLCGLIHDRKLTNSDNSSAFCGEMYRLKLYWNFAIVDDDNSFLTYRFGSEPSIHSVKTQTGSMEEIISFNQYFYVLCETCANRYYIQIFDHQYKLKCFLIFPDSFPQAEGSANLLVNEHYIAVTANRRVSVFENSFVAKMNVIKDI